MTRRPPDLRLPKAKARMAPGGRLWSESPVRRPYPRVRQSGEEPEVVVEPMPPTAFYTPELFFTGGKYWSDRNISFASAYWNGAPLAPTPPGVWTTINTSGFTLKVMWRSDLGGWSADVRFTSSGRYCRWWSTLPDVSGTGSDANTLVAIRCSLPSFNAYVHQSDVKATPSLTRTATVTDAVHNCWAPTNMAPVNWETPTNVTGTLRFSISSTA